MRSPRYSCRNILSWDVCLLTAKEIDDPLAVSSCLMKGSQNRAWRTCARGVVRSAGCVSLRKAATAPRPSPHGKMCARGAGPPPSWRPVQWQSSLSPVINSPRIQCGAQRLPSSSSSKSSYVLFFFFFLSNKLRKEMRTLKEMLCLGNLPRAAPLPTQACWRQPV